MTDQNLSIQPIVDGLTELLQWVAQHPRLREQDPAKRMTYREFHAEFDAKAGELGVGEEAVAPYREHPAVQDAETQLDMELGERELLEDEYFLDLPIGFRFLPEYAPVLKAEQDWIDANGGWLRKEDIPRVAEAIRPHIPQR